MAVTTIFMNNLTLPYCWHRCSKMRCVFWRSNYNWMNMGESTILLVDIAIFIVHLPILYFWFDQCLTCCIVQRYILYYKYNYKFPTYNLMAKTPEPFLSVHIMNFFCPYNNTFEQYFPKFSLQNIQNWASDSESPEAPRKKLFCGVHQNSQQNHLKQNNQNAFVKGVVSRGNSGRIFFSIFQFFVAFESQKTNFR